MSRPIAAKLGCRCRLRAKALVRLRMAYREINAEDVWKVVAIDYSRPKLVFIDQWSVDGPRRICVWARDVKMFPRCRDCNVEEHTTRACPERKVHGEADPDIDAPADVTPAPDDHSELRQASMLGSLENGNAPGNRGHAA